MYSLFGGTKVASSQTSCIETFYEFVFFVVVGFCFVLICLFVCLFLHFKTSPHLLKLFK